MEKDELEIGNSGIGEGAMDAFLLGRNDLVGL
jgi:hypothetical protein